MDLRIGQPDALAMLVQAVGQLDEPKRITAGLGLTEALQDVQPPPVNASLR